MKNQYVARIGFWSPGKAHDYVSGTIEADDELSAISAGVVSLHSVIPDAVVFLIEIEGAQTVRGRALLARPKMDTLRVCQ